MLSRHLEGLNHNFNDKFSSAPQVKVLGAKKINYSNEIIKTYDPRSRLHDPLIGSKPIGRMIHCQVGSTYIFCVEYNYSIIKREQHYSLHNYRYATHTAAIKCLISPGITKCSDFHYQPSQTLNESDLQYRFLIPVLSELFSMEPGTVLHFVFIILIEFTVIISASFKFICIIRRVNARYLRASRSFAFPLRCLLLYP